MFAGTVIPSFLNALLSYNARAVQFAELKNTVPCSRRIYKVVPPRLRSNFRTSPHPEGGPHTHEQSPPKPSRPRQTATYSHPLWICRFWTFYANGSVQRVWSFLTWHLPPSLTLARPARVVGCAVLWPFGVMDNIPLSGPVTFCFFIR